MKYLIYGIEKTELHKDDIDAEFKLKMGLMRIDTNLRFYTNEKTINVKFKCSSGFLESSLDKIKIEPYENFKSGNSFKTGQEYILIKSIETDFNLMNADHYTVEGKKVDILERNYIDYLDCCEIYLNYIYKTNTLPRTDEYDNILKEYELIKQERDEILSMLNHELELVREYNKNKKWYKFSKEFNTSDYDFDRKYIYREHRFIPR